MKNITFAVLLVVMVATPCLAQEIEPDGLFSIEGTMWGGCFISLGTFKPFLIMGCDLTGFHQGTVYGCSGEGNCIPLPGSSYTDLLVVSIFSVNTLHQSIYGILYPSGLGMTMSFVNSSDPTILAIRFGIRLEIKLDNNFSPPGQQPPELEGE